MGELLTDPFIATTRGANGQGFIKDLTEVVLFSGVVDGGTV